MLEADNEYSLFKRLLNINYSFFIDIASKQANLTDGSFEDILNIAMEYKENGYIDLSYPIPETGLSNRAVYGGGSIAASSDIAGDIETLLGIKPKPEFIYKSNSVFHLLEALIQEDPDTINNQIRQVRKYGITNDDEIIGLLSNDSGDVSITMSLSYSMNTNSKNKATAWAFMKFLLSTELQTMQPLGYIPINKNAVISIAKSEIAGAYFSDYSQKKYSEEAQASTQAAVESDPFNTYNQQDIQEVELTERQQETLDKYLDYLETYSTMLKTCMIHDVIINDMIYAEVIKFFNGSRTANEVARTLQSQIDLFLQE